MHISKLVFTTYRKASCRSDLYNTNKKRNILTDKNDLQYLKIIKGIVLGGGMLTEELVSELHAYTDATISNIYRPAETTVWSNKELKRQGYEYNK